ncbi:MAG: 4Fe-4S binding protein [Alkaliphilus sp.]
MKLNKNTFLIISEVVFLLVFIILLRQNLLNRWILIFGVGVLASVLFGRFYCAWVCPMETLFRPINWLYSKLGIKRADTPKILKNKYTKYAFLAFFFFAMILIKRNSLQINFLLFITLASVAVTLIFKEQFWHNVICPFGTILSLSSRFSLFGIQIDEEKCVSCAKCEVVCPNESIEILESNKRKIIKNNCLTCFKCEVACPVNVIEYEKLLK